jgi:hypothetical protein
MLRELVDLYEPVPFSHREHAEMAEMWEGCTTCHHHTPEVFAPKRQGRLDHPNQEDAAKVPACKSCHSTEDSSDLHMPSLKAAYHRQCLNCHRDWMDANACSACHSPRPQASASQPTTSRRPTTRPPSPDDIVGRMHKPIQPPQVKEYTTRFTPVAGPRVLFRHEEHVKEYGIKCVACHRGDSCSACHSPSAASAATSPVSRPLKAAATWEESHQPCVACHRNDACSSCHYQPGQTPPPRFNHDMTGQKLGKDHRKLACGDCHLAYNTPGALTCGDSSCHKKPMEFPRRRPGKYAPPAPTSRPATSAPSAVVPESAQEPATRPIIVRIRRGGS